MHDFFTDDDLWDYLASLDVSVLPYRFGTHSGWLEACYDLGTTVLAPTAASTPSSGPVLSYSHDEDGFDADVAGRGAVRRAYEQRPQLAAPSLRGAARQRAGARRRPRARSTAVAGPR